jgi:hypothetical protein
LIVFGAVGLFVSLFLTWSHQFSRAFLAEWGSSEQLRGVPHDPTAWQVYSAADVLLAVLAVLLLVVALLGTRQARLAALGATTVGLVFVLHALGHPPTNGANIFDPALSVPNYFPNSPAAGAGETVATVALALGLGGLVLSFTAD